MRRKSFSTKTLLSLSHTPFTPRLQPCNAIAPSSAAPYLGFSNADEFTKDIVELENRYALFFVPSTTTPISLSFSTSTTSLHLSSSAPPLSNLSSSHRSYVLQTYARPNVVFVKGEGSTLWDAHGNSYLDFTAGIAVNSLGHGHPSWLSAVREQAGELAHVSNLYHTAPQARLARKLVEAASPWASRAFFCNSGTEANEAAIKFARKFAKIKKGVDPYDASAPPSAAPYKLLSFDNCFHGRTMGALALTYKVQYKTPFEPIMPGVSLKV